MDLFAYGTLMDKEIMQHVSGQHAPSINATLQHFVRKGIKGQLYPGIVAQHGMQVTGLVYKGLSARAIERIDAFEGELYQRKLVLISSVCGEQSEVFTYVIKPEYVEQLTNAGWEFDAFIAQHKQPFTRNYIGFSELEI